MLNQYFQNRYQNISRIQHLFIIPVLICLILYSNSFAHFGEKFEPADGRVIHGVGQYDRVGYTDADNWGYLNDYQDAVGIIPTIYSVYTYISPRYNVKYGEDLTTLVNNPSSPHPYILLVGLALFDIGSSGVGQMVVHVDSILGGYFDSEIIRIASEIKQIDGPVYLRPGYEMGVENGGLHWSPDIPTGDIFIDIWIHIYDVFEQENVTNVAWVWDVVNPHDPDWDYMEWYPGDQYVDWWGINYLHTGQIGWDDYFLDTAADHNKPVMLCEVCPALTGTLNYVSWTDFFLTLFDKIASTPHIKALVYLSEPWSQGVIQHWLDTRLTTNSSITNQALLQNYTDEIDNPEYIHLAEYLQNPELIDTSLPVFLSSFKVYSEIDYNLIEWETSSELDNFGFNIYKASSEGTVPPEASEFLKLNEQLIRGAGNTSDPQFYSIQDSDVEEQRYYWYQLEDVDYNGNATRHDIVKIHRSGNYVNSFALHQNYPNPFNPVTTIAFDLPQRGSVSIQLYDNLGKMVKSLLNDDLPSGSHEITVYAENLSSGIYFYKIETGTYQDVKKMMLLR